MPNLAINFIPSIYNIDLLFRGTQTLTRLKCPANLSASTLSAQTPREQQYDQRATTAQQPRWPDMMMGPLSLHGGPSISGRVIRVVVLWVISVWFDRDLARLSDRVVAFAEIALGAKTIRGKEKR